MKKLKSQTPEDLLELITTAINEGVGIVPYFTTTFVDEHETLPPDEVEVDGKVFVRNIVGKVHSISTPVEGVGTNVYQYHMKDVSGLNHEWPDTVFSYLTDSIKESLRLHFSVFGFDPVKIVLEDTSSLLTTCTELNRMCKNVKFSIGSERYGDESDYIHAISFVPFTSSGVGKKTPKCVEVSRPYFSMIGYLRACSKIRKQPSFLADGYKKNLVINAKAVFGSDSISEQTMRYNGQYLNVLAKRHGIEIMVRGKIPLVDKRTSEVNWTCFKTWSTVNNDCNE